MKQSTCIDFKCDQRTGSFKKETRWLSQWKTQTLQWRGWNFSSFFLYDFLCFQLSCVSWRVAEVKFFTVSFKVWRSFRPIQVEFSFCSVLPWETSHDLPLLTVNIQICCPFSRKKSVCNRWHTSNATKLEASPFVWMNSCLDEWFVGSTWELYLSLSYAAGYGRLITFFYQLSLSYFITLSYYYYFNNRFKKISKQNAKTTTDSTKNGSVSFLTAIYKYLRRHSFLLLSITFLINYFTRSFKKENEFFPHVFASCIADDVVVAVCVFFIQMGKCDVNSCSFWLMLIINAFFIIILGLHLQNNTKIHRYCYLTIRCRLWLW